MRSFILPAVVGLSLSMDPALAAEKIVIGTEAGFAPFAYVDASGNLVGFEIELGNAICEHAKVDCSWENVPWDGLFTSLDAGKFDAVMAGVTVTEERKKRFVFSQPYLVDSISLIAAKGSGYKATAEAMADATVGTLSGTAVSSFMRDHWQDVERRDYPSWDEAWVDLTAGRIDAILGYRSQIVSTYLSKAENAEKFEIADTLDDPNFPDPQFAVVFNKDSHPFLQSTDAALEALRADGTFDRLVAKHFPGFKSD